MHVVHNGTPTLDRKTSTYHVGQVIVWIIVVGNMEVYTLLWWIL